MSQPQDQPQPGQDWNDLSTKEVEETLQAASDLAYQLAGDIGSQSPGPGYRDTTELAAIEGALDTELKQLEHLVDKTRQQLSEDSVSSPAPTPTPSNATSSVPDFMAEFMADEPVTAVPVATPAGGSGHSGGSFDAHSSPAPMQKPGLVGIGTLGQIDTKKKSRAEEDASNAQAIVPKKSVTDKLEMPLYKACSGLTVVLETIDKPFAKLSPGVRKALSVTALAAFGTCLALFIASLLFA